jgi:glutamate synthase domain-containing protein 1
MAGGPRGAGCPGDLARETRPSIAQVLVRRPAAKDAERWAFRARKRIEQAGRELGLPVYVASLSFATGS